MKNFFLFSLFSFFLPFLLVGQTENYPVLFKGRYRPATVYAKLWLFDFSHDDHFRLKEEKKFMPNSALDFLLQLSVMGHEPWKNSPLFWVDSKEIKKITGLPTKTRRFSYNELNQAFYRHPATSLKLLKSLLFFELLNNHFSSVQTDLPRRFPLKFFKQTLLVSVCSSSVTLLAVPQDFPWTISTPLQWTFDLKEEQKKMKKYKKIMESFSFLTKELYQFAQIIPLKVSQQKFYNTYVQLKKLSFSPQEISKRLEEAFPLKMRLLSASSLLLALPGQDGKEWFSLNSLGLLTYCPEKNSLKPIKNFTLYSNQNFKKIQSRFLKMQKAILQGDQEEINSSQQAIARALCTAYASLENKVASRAEKKAIYYPSFNQLKAENYYYLYPWMKIIIIFYSIAAIFLYFSYFFPSSFVNRLGLSLFALTFFFHTLLLIGRSYLLSRPPVANMFETVMYVPWVASLIACVFYLRKKNTLPLLAASSIAVVLLSLAEFTQLSQDLENVQAVLDSQFWLFIHVLLVVGSYGLFALGALLAHFYLGAFCIGFKPSSSLTLVNSILQSLYLGLTLLIVGTLLGGIWAAESWGRFWDWDPKESWAFISICLYLACVHAYRYHKISAFGLSVGAIVGFLAISFTWYGVNYILGTGLHSYGFGSGGQTFYYSFIFIELFFLFCSFFAYRHKKM